MSYLASLNWLKERKRDFYRSGGPRFFFPAARLLYWLVYIYTIIYIYTQKAGKIEGREEGYKGVPDTAVASQFIPAFVVINDNFITSLISVPFVCFWKIA